MNNLDNELILVYDDECPVCRNYCQYIRIKKTVGNLKLIDARKSSLIMDEITKMNLNIDEGMVVKFKNTIYYGSDAIHVLSLLSTRSGWFNTLNFWAFRSRIISHILYPICKTIRNFILWASGIEKINNLKTQT